MADHYQRLGITPDCDFAALKKAYYRRAKECHPDHHHGHPAKAEAFKQLVEAFNVLSDPLQRALYDAQYGAPNFNRDTTPAVETLREEACILDTPADDILEEMIVGNTIPKNTTLQTLMLDLERTERFCLFREGKTFFYQGHIARAQRIFDHYLILAPLNILAHYYRGRCLVQQRQYAQAARAYGEAIRIGDRRRPPLHCARIRRERDRLQRTKRHWLVRTMAWWRDPCPAQESLPPDEAARKELARAMHNLITEETRRKRLKLELNQL